MQKTHLRRKNAEKNTYICRIIEKATTIMYIWQHPEWPNFRWNENKLITQLGRVRFLQGVLAGKIIALGFDTELSTSLDAMTQDIIKSSEIEGVMLNPESVRSSIAWQLGIREEALPPSDHYVEGLVGVMIDAVSRYEDDITSERLCGWHEALFPHNKRISVGAWRTSEEPMRVVSGIIGRETVHYEAPASKDVPAEMERFLEWLNSDNTSDPIIKSGIAALWFVSIHPFADGNGRISRTLTDLLLTRSDGMRHRFYSMSAAIHSDRKGYYDILESTQKGDLDITEWLMWFLLTLEKALHNSEAKIEHVIQKATYWEKHAHVALNERQRKVMARLLDGLEGKLNTSKWAKLAKCSTDTALRDIQDLTDKGMLERQGEGRGTHYILR